MLNCATMAKKSNEKRGPKKKSQFTYSTVQYAHSTVRASATGFFAQYTVERQVRHGDGVCSVRSLSAEQGACILQASGAHSDLASGASAPGSHAPAGVPCFYSFQDIDLHCAAVHLHMMASQMRNLGELFETAA